MQRISRDHARYAYDPNEPPALTVEPGETLLFETLDARTGSLFSYAPGSLVDLTPPIPGRSNPVTGPVAVAGAKPGDALVVDVLDIACGPVGYIGAHAHQNPLAKGRIPATKARICAVRDGSVEFTPGIRIPLQPMIGCIGTAPEGQAVVSGLPGSHGGNLDHNVVRPGTRVTLPVYVAGGLLSIGDVHASMGDGELSGAGIEVAAQVTVIVHLRSGAHLRHPWIETPDRIAAVSCADDFADARRAVVESVVSALEEQRGLSPAESLMLISAVGDLRPGQAFGGMPLTLRLEMPRALGLVPGS